MVYQCLVANYECCRTTNLLGGFILTQHLLPILSRTANRQGSLPGTVRVVWPASVLVELGAPLSGINKDWLQDPGLDMDYVELYSQSKAGVWFLASEFARRQSPSQNGVLFIAGNPGTYNTGMWQYTPTLLKWLFRPIMRDPSVHGADTYLWMGFSKSVTIDDAIAGRCMYKPPIPTLRSFIRLLESFGMYHFVLCSRLLTQNRCDV